MAELGTEIKSPDSVKLSILWGRLGASILAVVGIISALLGYDFDEKTQQLVFDNINAMISSGAIVVSAIMGVVSKYRSMKRNGQLSPPAK